MSDFVDISPDRFAPLIAPVIERLTFAVVDRARARAASGTGPASGPGASAPGPGSAPPGAMRMFGQLRTALLARDITPTGLAAIYRYRDPDDIHRDLDGLQMAGLIDKNDDGAIRATQRGRAVLTQMYRASADVTAELWAEHEDRLAAVNTLAGQLVSTALVTGGDAYKTMAPPYEPDDATVGLLVHHRLSVLRYHRADAHAAAWQAAGLTSAGIKQMPTGSDRDAIEAETNRRAGVPYSSLEPDERLMLLADLAALAG